MIELLKVVGSPLVKYTIAGRESVIYWLEDNKDEVLRVIRSECNIYTDDDEGPRWILTGAINVVMLWKLSRLHSHAFNRH